MEKGGLAGNDRFLTLYIQNPDLVISFKKYVTKSGFYRINAVQKLSKLFIMKTKNILVYYLLIFIPLGVLISSAKNDLINATIFFIGLQVYVFLYHPYVSGLRLLALKKLEKKDFWRMFIPFWDTIHFKTLFLDF